MELTCPPPSSSLCSFFSLLVLPLISPLLPPLLSALTLCLSVPVCLGQIPALVTEGRKRDDFSREEAGGLRDPEAPPAQTGHKASCCGGWQAAERGSGWPKLMHLGIPLQEKQYKMTSSKLDSGTQKGPSSKGPCSCTYELLGKLLLLLRSRITGVLAWPSGPRGPGLLGCPDLQRLLRPTDQGEGLAQALQQAGQSCSAWAVSRPSPHGLRFFFYLVPWSSSL